MVRFGSSFKERWISDQIEHNKGKILNFEIQCVNCGNPREGTVFTRNPAIEEERKEKPLCGVCFNCAPKIAFEFTNNGYLVRIEWTEEKVHFT